VDADGYNSISQSVTVQNNTVTTNDVTLQSDSNTDDEDGTTDDGSTTDDSTEDEDSTKSDGAIGVEIVVDEYRIVENQEVNLTAELSGATGDEVSFEWFVSGESFGGDTQSIEYVFDDAGDYRVSVRVTEDATGEIVEGNLYLDEEDWTEDGEIIYTDLIVKTYNADGNPVNALVYVKYIGSEGGHTTEFQVVADRKNIIYASDYINDGSDRINAKKTNVSVAAGETKTVELTLIDHSGLSYYDIDSCWYSCIWAYQNGTIWGSGDEILPPDSGDGDGGISATILLSILAAATLLIIIGVFWLFKLLAAVLGIDGGNGLGRLLRGEDD
jgi:hypothetical protein